MTGTKSMRGPLEQCRIGGEHANRSESPPGAGWDFRHRQKYELRIRSSLNGFVKKTPPAFASFLDQSQFR
jgi:hypothetical protein